MDEPFCAEPDHWIDPCECSPGTFASGLAAWSNEVLVGTSTDDLDFEDKRPRPAACLFRRPAKGGWQHVQTLFPVAMRGYEGVPVGFAEDLLLGSSFAIVGGVDAPNGDGATLDFERAERGPFALRGSVDPPAIDDFTTDSFGQFGTALAADENTLVVGAPFESNPQEDESALVGMVYVFGRTPSTPVLTMLHGSRADGLFGHSLALSGDLLVVGAPGERKGTGRTDGAVYVYQRAQHGWAHVARIEGAAGERLGHCVAIDGQRFAVTAPGSGRLVLFEVVNGACAETASLQRRQGFGESLAFSDGRIAVGEPTAVASNLTAEGCVALIRVGSSGTLSPYAWLTSRVRRGRLGGRVALGTDFVAAQLEADGAAAVGIGAFPP